jgi:hypothetical protein
MFSTCPKCESGHIDTTGTCSNCRYTLRVHCESCGHQNIPTARFCGGCGNGMSLQIRLQSYLNRKITYLQRLRMRKFVTGAAFGSLLAFFAFGSMGMISENNDHPVSAVSEKISIDSVQLNSAAATIFDNELATRLSGRDLDTIASVSDLETIMDLLIQHLRPVAEKLNKKRFPQESARNYSCLLHNFSRENELSRGATALMLFHFLSDFLELNYSDYSEAESFSDIPRFHFLSAPAAAVTRLGLNIAGSNHEFGINDPVSLLELQSFARRVMALAEPRLDKISARTVKK